MPYLAPPPLALAHRGGLAEAPENSRAAIERMLEIGLRYLETDVRITADGEAVLAHDATLERVMGDPRPVAAVTWDEASALRDASGEGLVRLADVLRDFPRLHVNVDAKSDDAVGPLVRTVLAAGAGDRVCVTSFDAGRVRRLRAGLGDGVATGTGLADAVRLWVASWLPRPARGLALRTVASAAVAQVPENWRGLHVLTPAFLRAAHEHGMQVHVWVVNAEADMHRLLDLGVDGLVTDRPSVLRGVLTERGQWREHA
ncbi:glycerophosphoryl diester phosphodiesterase [Beutenbergia cavernae DSM 12333]|uniref:Glycerophosphoryl diester phosphodiesterase n=1 Tax=Beutenbergia cavernae (strain ATCC BAA-8 / DSM 12333 / CCUG 43141 / JCM 11478 / NBRC 16432 / NCIMB 13614 / HKI 0122) TaxID=471853 RepID=C5BXL5_BEUC1|nr:glycerophosphodiester phosphodiesterase family protein [Beutenbergia cavernae]ACQ80898.1 glycerophosphoryl diester phosphodiesterase [Beutenbergia cavernae DSM 12333]